MKKYFALLLVLSLMLTMLAGCSKEDTAPTTETPTESTTEPTTEAPTTEEPTTEEPTTEEPTTEEPTTEEPTTEEPTESTEEIGLLGTVEGNVYTNLFAGFGCTLDDSWHIYNEAEMAVLMGLTTNMYNDESIKAAIEASGTAMVFYATTELGMPNMNITVEDMGTAASIMTVDQYVNALLVTLEQSLGTAGFTNIITEKATVTFAGEEIPAIALSAEVAGVPIHELLVPMIRGNYMFNITICSATAEECLDVLSLFHATGSDI